MQNQEFTENTNFDTVAQRSCINCKYHHREQDPSHGKSVHYCSALDMKISKEFFCGNWEKVDFN